jgi:hypothetical protein
MSSSHGIIRTIYLYLFALVGLFLFVFSTVNFIGALLDRYVWPQEFVQYDYREAGMTKCIGVTPCVPENVQTIEQQKEQFIQQQNNELKRRTNQAAPGVVVGYLLWLFHWNWIKRDKKKEE